MWQSPFIQRVLHQLPPPIVACHVINSSELSQSQLDKCPRPCNALKTATGFASAHVSRTQPSISISLSSRKQIRSGVFKQHVRLTSSI
ncbi:hypothetical protein Scep_009856 [Stephania cephalantha]|uniref:Uncharacterized protein n=1 Tax=Stephania cephalantha TaxID=152367 RepID=A0AAP0JW75_9MAGN